MVPSDPDIPSFKDNPDSPSPPSEGGEEGRQPFKETPLPVRRGEGEATCGLPPPLLPKSNAKPSSARQFLGILLGLGLGLFLADAAVSLVDDSLILFFDIHVLTVIRGVVYLLALLMAIVIYGLMGLAPMIPKRLFLPLTLFYPVTGLLLVPFLIYFHDRLQQAAWGISCCQVIFVLGMLYGFQGGFKFRRPLLSGHPLAARRFAWRHLSIFLLVHVFVLLPALVVYLVFWAAVAVDHFSEGFLALRPAGLTVQVRKYVRNDGRTIQLVPMSHIGEPEFYRTLSQSFPTSSIILMEGVTDNRNLLTNSITYQRMAATLGVAEQENEFMPQGEVVQADVDVEVFTTNTIRFLNLVMLIHARGLNHETMLSLMEFSPPHFEEQLFEDLLRKRNRRLLQEIQARLSQAQNLIVPWGAAHIPEIAREIQKSGFRLEETRDYVAIRFRSAGKKSKRAWKRGDAHRE